MRAEGAVDQALDPAHGQVAAARILDAIPGQPLGERVVVIGQHHPQPHRQLAGLGEPAQHLHLGKARAGVLEAGDPVGQALGGGKVSHLAQLVRARLPLGERGHRIRRGLAQHAGRQACGVAQDLAALRIGRLRRDPGQLHGPRVDDRRVAARVGQQHRVGRRRQAQLGVQRQAADRWVGRRRPLLLVPAASDDPLAGLGRGRRLGDHRHDRGPVRRLPQVELHLRPAQGQEVAVGLDQPGHRHRAGEVEDLGLGSDQGAHLVLGADRDDQVAPRGERLRLWLEAVHGDDRAPEHHEVGRLRAATAGCQHHHDRHHHNRADRSSPHRDSLHAFLRRVPLLPRQAKRPTPARVSRIRARHWPDAILDSKCLRAVLACFAETRRLLTNPPSSADRRSRQGDLR